MRKIRKKRGGSWCTAKIAKRYLKNESKCVKHGCKWVKAFRIGKGFPLTEAECEKMSSYDRAKVENKKTYCGKFRATKKSCPKSRCIFVDQGSGGTWCRDKKTTRRKNKSKKNRRKRRRKSIRRRTRFRKTHRRRY